MKLNWIEPWNCIAQAVPVHQTHSKADALERFVWLSGNNLCFVSNPSGYWSVEHPTSITLSVLTGLCEDANAVCSASIDSLQSIIRVQRYNYADPFTCLCHSPWCVGQIILRSTFRMWPLAVTIRNKQKNPPSLSSPSQGLDKDNSNGRKCTWSPIFLWQITQISRCCLQILFHHQIPWANRYQHADVTPFQRLPTSVYCTVLK